MDVYWNASRANGKPRPGVLLLHGGYWWGGDKKAWSYAARRLAARGFTVFAPNYRLSGKARWPAQRDDALATLAFIKRNAKRWNTDPARMAVIGSSAGGHLATQLGTYGSGARRVRGVVALSPVNSPYLAYQDGGKPEATRPQVRLRDAVAQLVDCTPSEQDASCWKRLQDASSTAHVTRGDAPMLLMHGSADFVPVTHSTGLSQALRAAGVRSAVRTVPGELHGGALISDPRTFAYVVKWLRTVV